MSFFGLLAVALMALTPVLLAQVDGPGRRGDIPAARESGGDEVEVEAEVEAGSDADAEVTPDTPADADAPADADPAVEPEPAEPAGVIGSHQERQTLDALLGLWINTTGPRTLNLVFYADGQYALDGVDGTYDVRGNELILDSPATGTVAYSMELTSDALILSGGDLRRELRFGRQADIWAWLQGITRFSPESARQRLFRILLIIAIVLVARLIILLIRGLLHLLVVWDWGPFNFFWKHNKNRAMTIHSLILNVVKYTVYLWALGFILTELGVNYTTYLASLSVIGLAIGFGSQGLVQDMVTGFFVIFEGQFDVGDMVEISGQVGVVTELGLRMTKMRNYLGQNVVIPNRNIAVVGNFSKGAQLASIDVAVPASEPTHERESALLEKIGSELARQFSGVIASEPKVVGKLALATGEHFVRLQVQFWPQQLWVIDQQLLPRIRETFKRENIEIPNDRIAVFYHTRQQPTLDWRHFVETIKSRFDKSSGAFEI